MADKKIKIVLVEDDKFLSKMYQSKLSMEGMDVNAAYDGEEGLEMVKKEKPDIILLDIVLPKMEGWDVLKAIKDDLEVKDIPVIILSNLGQEEDVRKGQSLGAADYLIKAHFVPREVIEKIKSILGDK
ncbi:response regulator [Patescibacteria group bacterium]|nr:response regulator [Patescibacteria group bacterium]MBU1673016.1 response regulator [Patescibacteria group bacterium]MBU1964175.1 response regulator [Patescibacteria group bacterium]